MQNAGLAEHVTIQPLEIADAVRDARDIGMDADRHHATRHRTFLVQAIEVIAAAAQQLLGRMMLHDHHRDVVYLDRVRNREHRTVRGRDVDRLVVEHPVGDVFDSGFGQMIDGLEGLCQAGTLPAARCLAGKGANRLDRISDRRPLVLDLVHGLLLPAVPHEFPPRVLRRLRDARIVAAHHAVDRERGRHAGFLHAIEQPPEAHTHAVLVPGPVR